MTGLLTSWGVKALPFDEEKHPRDHGRFSHVAITTYRMNPAVRKQLAADPGAADWHKWAAFHEEPPTGSHVTVARDENGKVLGAAEHYDYQRDTVLKSLHVRDDIIGGGIGSRLMQHVAQHAIDKPQPHTRALYVSGALVSARPFYEKMGGTHLSPAQTRALAAGKPVDEEGKPINLPGTYADRLAIHIRRSQGYSTYDYADLLRDRATADPGVKSSRSGILSVWGERLTDRSAMQTKTFTEDLHPRDHGKFAAKLAGMHPSEIDADYTPLIAKHQDAIQAIQDVHETNRLRARRGQEPHPAAADRLSKLTDQAAKIAEARKPYDDEWNRRGGWTRAFIVPGGHVHSSMRCSTCYPTTQFHLLSELSGHDEKEIVNQAGNRACTICYPSAPVETLSRPSKLFTPDEERAAKARAERDAASAAKKAKQDADKLTDVDGSAIDSYYLARGIGEREATRDAVSALHDERAFGYKPQHEFVDKVVRAVAAKHGKPESEVRADIERKVAAKIKRTDAEQRKIDRAREAYRAKVDGQG